MYGLKGYAGFGEAFCREKFAGLNEINSIRLRRPHFTLDPQHLKSF